MVVSRPDRLDKAFAFQVDDEDMAVETATDAPAFVSDETEF